MSSEYDLDISYKDCDGVKIYDGDILYYIDDLDVYDFIVIRIDNSYNVLV